MALEYEVRAEYQSMSLEQLLDTTVMCFEGVGDTQNDILNRYFGVTTIRQLANLPYFLWSLGIQETALKGGDSSSKPVSELAQTETLKFSIRDMEQGKNAVELFNSPVNVLDGLTPAQNLALYDAFRITNVVQLAHNRIMLEARVIEYLQKHPELISDSQAVDKDEIASILGADTMVPGSGEEAAAGQEGAGLRQMAGEISEHVRGRIDALKDRAAERARELSSREGAGGADLAADVERARETASSRVGRVEALRQVRERTDASREQAGEARGQADEARERTEATRVQSVSESAGQEGAAGAAGAAGTDVSTGAPSMTVRPPGAGEATEDQEAAAEGGAAEGGGPEGAVAGETPEEAPPKGFSFKPWMAAAGAAVVVLIGLLLWLVLGRESAEPPAPVVQSEPQEPEKTAETTQPAGAQPAATQPAGTQPAATQPPPRPEVPIRTVHTVSKGQSLWRIARRHYGNPLLWPKIFDVNKDQIEDPDLIYPDQKFKIPEDN